MAIVHQEEGEGSFRDNLSTIHKDGSRNWLYPHKPSGKYYTARSIVSVFLLAFLFLAPFVKIDGRPILLFNILERKFIIFTIPFWPQDFYLIVLGILVALVSIVLFTAIFGRLWCGWLCPQTVFLEMLFRKIEFAIEGSAIKQRILDDAPMSAEKFLKKGVKHVIFFGLSFVIANVFLAYIIGSEQLWQIITDPPMQHISGLFSITVFSLLFYGVFARFREQACIVVCPYGRYQSALVDNDTVAVTYDFKRGEPRKKFSREDKKAREKAETATAERGDCIDCNQCVVVCPTGIDIRNGIQLECVNCTACMDACDEVMTKVSKPTGLIRYTSYTTVKTGVKWKVKTRIVGYAAVWMILMTVFTFLFVSRPSSEVLILRQPGTLFQKMGNGNIANFYSIQVVNKTYYDMPIELRLLSPEGGTITILGAFSPILQQSSKDTKFFLELPVSRLTGTQTKITFGVYSNGILVKKIESSFVSPDKL